MRRKLKHEGKEGEKERVGQRRKRHLSSELCFQFLVTDTTSEAFLCFVVQLLQPAF